MASASPSLIGLSWASADGFRRSLGRSQLLLRGTLHWFDFFATRPNSKTHLIIEFDQLGNITALEEFATVKLYNG